jgi:virginiamycin B lyase
MKLAGAIRQIVQKGLELSGASPDLTRRITRFQARLESLEGRALLSRGLTEFPIASPVGGGNDQLECIISGPDKSIWFLDNIGSAEQIGEITPAGKVTWFPAVSDPSDIDPPTGFLAPGPDGLVWFNTTSEIGKITPAGVVTLYPAPEIAPTISGLTPGQDGNVWFISSSTMSDSGSQSASVVGRITPSGEITTFPILPGPLADQVATGPIVEARDGKLWFGAIVPTSNGGAELDMGSVTPSGQSTLYPIGQTGETIEGGLGFDLTRGPDGKPWLIDGGLPIENASGKDLNDAILRIDSSGRFKPFQVSLASSRLLGAIASGPKHNLFFTVTDNNVDVGPNPEPTIGKLSLSGPGRVSFQSVPKNLAPNFWGGGIFSPLPITVGPDGNIWYITADPNQDQAIVRLKTH